MMPNWFASFALMMWPLVSIYLYASRSVAKATLWTILAAELLLPVGTFFKFAMVPQLDKNSIPSICALIGCVLLTRRAVKISRKFGFVELLIGVYLFSPLVTSLLNNDPIYVGSKVLPGVGAYDGLSAVLTQFVSLVPFFLGRRVLRTSDDLQSVFSVLVIAGTAYSFLLLFEIRMSPQLHFWLYGYYPSDFIQEIRDGGGFRPMAFMGHGLIACFFAMTVAVASAVLWRAKITVLRVPLGVLTAYLSGVLVLCKSGAALVYGVVLIPLVHWAKPRVQSKIAVILVCLALTYPVMRISEMFPTTIIENAAIGVSESRGYSLKFRFDQEEALLQRASERFLFGWGRFGRNRIYVENWEGVGGDASVTDGRWIITLGQFGLVGFLAEFGLLGIGVFFVSRALLFVESFRHAVLLAGLSLLISVNIVELMPNSTLSPWTWLQVGALLGSSEAILASARRQKRGRSPAMLFAKP